MADRIASGEIHIEVNDREAIASLHRIDAEFDREMSKIDRQHADVKVGADLSKLNRDLREAVKKTQAAEEKMNAAENKRSKAQLKRTAERRKAEEEAARKAYWDAKNRADAQKQVNKQLDATEKRLVAIAKRDEKIAKASEKAAKQQQADARERMRNIDREAKRRKGLTDQRVREERADERAANALRREQASVPKLERSYMRLQDRLEKLAQAKTKAGKDVRSHVLIEIDEHDTLRELERIKKRIHNAVGRDPIGLPAKPVMGRQAGRNLRLDFENNSRQLGPAAAAAGVRIGRTMGQKVAQGFRNMTERGGIMANTRALGSALSGAAGRGATSGLSRIGHAFDGLANMTVRLGPFTSTIRQLMVAMSLLGPLVIDVVGALGSLVSVVGSGALGLANLGTAIVGGGIPALIGMVTVLKPVIGEMKNATKASQNYQKAVREYGKGSPEAAKKLDIFNNVMKNQTKETKANFLAAGRLKDAWAKATEPSRAKTFDLMGKGLKYLTNNVGFFGKRTNDTFTAVHGSMDRWLNGLKSAEGHQVLGTMMDNFNNALGPALDGLGSLAAVFARFGASASRYLPDMTAKFQDWAHGLLDGSKDADVVNKKVDKMMTSLKSVGRFLMASGRLLVAFFRGGVDAGTSFTDTMTHAMNRWTKFLNSTEGQNSLGDFFSEAVAGAQTLWGFLAPLIKGFFEWSSAIAPVARGIGEALSVLSKLVGAFSHLAGMGGVLTGLGATLATIWAVGKIQTATMAVANFGRALLGVQALGARGAAKSFLGGTFGRDAAALRNASAPPRTFTRPPPTQSFPAPVPVGAGAAAARDAEKVAVAAARSGGALRTAAHGAAAFAGGLLGVSAGAAVALGGAVALGFGINAINNALHAGERAAWRHTMALEATVRKNVDGVRASNTSYMAARDTLGSYASQVQHANIGVREARKALKDTSKGTQEYRDRLLDLHDAERQRIEDRKAYFDSQAQMNTSAKQQVKNANAAVDANKREIASLKERMQNGTVEQRAKAMVMLNEALKRQAALSENAAAAETRLAAVPAQLARGIKGFAALTGEAEQAVGRLARTAGGKQVALKVSTKYDDPNKAGKVASKARSALQSGVGKGAVMRIVADSRSADQAVRRLQAARITPKKLTILEAGGAHAVKVLEAIIGRKLTRKEQKIAQQGGPAVLALLEKINDRKLREKVQKLSIQGVGAVMAGLNSVIRKNVPNKRFTISLINNALGPINSIINAVGRLHDKTVTVTTQHRDIQVKGGYAGRVIEAAASGQDMVGRALAAASARQPKVTRGGKYSAPTLLVGEENRTEYVIATNPSYRENNKRYLTRAAGDLGMAVVDTAANGREPTASAAGKKKKKHHGKWKVPNKYKFGGVPEDVIQRQYDAAKTARENMEQRADSKHSDAKSASKKKKPGLLADEAKLRKKIPALKVREAHLKKELDAVKKVNRRIDMLNLQIEGERTAMETAAKGNKLAGPHNKHGYKEGEPLAPDGLSFNDHRTKRTGYMDTLKGVLKHALKYAGGQYAQTIKNEIATINSDRVDVDRDAGFVRETTDRTVDDLLRDYGYSDNIAREQAAIAIDRTQNLGDPSTWTGDARTDYEGDAGRLRDTYKEALDRAVKENVDPNLISGLAELYTSARDAVLPPDNNNNSEAPQGVVYSGAIADSLKADVLRDFGGNTSAFSGLPVSDPSTMGAAWTQVNPAALNPAVAAAAGPSPSTAAPGTGGGGVTKVLNQTNNFQQPPADAHTFSQGIAFELGAAI